MTGSVRTPDELQAMREHISYENGMLQACARLYPSMAGNLANAVLESFIVHFRVLADFYWPRGTPHSDDVVATAFSPAWQVPPPAADLEANRIRANKHLAHLTWTRAGVVAANKSWEIGRIADEFAVAHASWLASQVGPAGVAQAPMPGLISSPIAAIVGATTYQAPTGKDT